MGRGAIRSAGLLLALGGCTGQQAVLAPMGPEASLLARLSWLLFAGGGAIFVLTMVLLVLALGGGPGMRRRLASRRAILLGGIAFPVVVLSALLVHTLVLAAGLGARGADAPLRVEVIGRQFWWEVRYPDHGIVTANEIHLPAAREVEFLLSSPDVIHSFWVPALHGKLDMIPGRVNRLRLTTGAPAVLRGQCAEFCGAQHALMAFFVVVETEAEFARWAEAQRAPAREPTDPFLALGWRAFGEAGCGACHAVRGTPWSGRAGPDLTLLGTRRSLGAGALDNHLATLAGWIGAPQALKPGNAMPGFAAVLEGRELRAVAAWLESLR